jgi:hypothetical protein
VHVRLDTLFRLSRQHAIVGEPARSQRGTRTLIARTGIGGR